MAYNFPLFVAVVKDSRGKIRLASAMENDDFLGEMKPGDVLVAGTNSRAATGAMRRIIESRDPVQTNESGPEGISLMQAFEKMMLDLVEDALVFGAKG